MAIKLQLGEELCGEGGERGTLEFRSRDSRKYTTVYITMQLIYYGYHIPSHDNN